MRQQKGRFKSMNKYKQENTSVMQNTIQANVNTVALTDTDVSSPAAIMAKADSETRALIESKRADLNVYNEDILLTFGDDEMKNIDTFANSVLESTKLKDQPEVGELLSKMMSTMSTIDTKSLSPANKGIFGKLFKVNNVKKWLAQFDSVSEVIDKIQDNLVECQYALKRDIELCNVFEKKAIEHLYSLDVDIMALTLEKQDFEESIQDITDPMEQRQAGYILDRVESKLQNLLLSRGICTIILPQMELIKSMNFKHIDKIKMMAGPSVSAWKQQATVAVLNQHTHNAMLAEKAATEFTNNMLEGVAKQLHTTMVDSAKESTRGIADVEVLNKVVTEMRATITDVNKVLEDGRKKRSADLQKLQSSIQDMRPMLAKDNRN